MADDSDRSSLGSDDPLDDDWLSRKLNEEIGEKKRKQTASTSNMTTEDDDSATFTIVTWNFWFSLYEWQARLEALLIESLQCDPDVLCFQEITTNVHNVMLHCAHLRESYYPTEEKLPHGYDCTIWIKKDRFKLISTTTIPLDSIYGRRGLLVDLEMAASAMSHTGHAPNGKSLPQPQRQARIRVVTTHLESGKDMGSTRLKQLRALFPSIQSIPWPSPTTKQTEKPSRTKADVAFLVGDFNLDPCSNPKENQLVDSNGCDLWKLLKPQEHGFTENTHLNQMRYIAHGPKHKQVRYDRVIMIDDEKTMDGICLLERAPKVTKNINAKEAPAYYFIPQCIALLGTSPFDNAKCIWPSDHFGLVSTVSIGKTSL